MDSTLFTLLVIVVSIIIIYIIGGYAISKKELKEYKEKLDEKVQNKYNDWVKRDLENFKKQIEVNSKKELENEKTKWISEKTGKIRSEAIIQSKAVNLGLIAEQLFPYFPEYTYNPKDAKFIGNPIDFIVFDGLNEGLIRNIIFMEVKSGAHKRLTRNGQLVSDAVNKKRIEWQIIKIKRK